MNTLQSLSASLADAVEAIAPSLVHVPGLHGSATGVAWSADTVLTTARIAMRRDAFDVVLPSGERAPAQVLGRDPRLDLALLRVAGLTPPPLADEPPRAGEIVLLLGRTARLRAALGVVAARGPAWTSPHGAELSAFIDVDAELPDGFAGGPLVDASGRVVGINTRGVVRGGTTIPVATLRNAAERLATRGTVRRGRLGVGLAPVTVDVPGAGPTSGLLLSSVEAAGAAGAAGLLAGDVLLSFAGRPVPDGSTLAALLAEVGPGSPIAVTLLRAGAIIDRSVTPTAGT